MTKNKVFCVIPRHLDFPPRTGDAIRVLEQCIDLSKNGFEVHLIFFNSLGTAYFTKIPLNIKFYPIKGDASLFNINSWRIIPQILLNYYVFLFQLYKYIKINISLEEKFLIHAHTPEGGIFGIILKLLLKKPLVYDPHDWYYEDWVMELENVSKITQNLLIFVYKVLSILLPRMSDITLVLNNFMLEKVSSKRKVIVPNYFMEIVDVEDKNSLKAIDGLIVFVGSIEEWQGLDLLISVFSSIEKEDEKATLWLVGDGEHLDYYRQLVSTLGLKKVKFWGRVSRKEVLKLISVAEVCTVPFLPRRFCLTACPLKILEYMSRGKKIVASDLPGIKEILDGSKKAFIFHAGNRESLFQAIRDSLNTKIDADDSSILMRSRNLAIRNLLITYQYFFRKNK